jgi:hypothetical protein
LCSSTRCSLQRLATEEGLRKTSSTERRLDGHCCSWRGRTRRRKGRKGKWRGGGSRRACGGSEEGGRGGGREGGREGGGGRRARAKGNWPGSRRRWRRPRRTGSWWPGISLSIPQVGRAGGRADGREGGREEGRDGGREGGREGRRDGGRGWGRPI